MARRRRRRLPILLVLVVTGWAVLEWIARSQSFAWTETLSVLVVPMVAPELEATVRETVIDTFLDLRRDDGQGLGAVRAWFEDEFRRLTGRNGHGLRIALNDVTRDQRPPPVLQSANPGRFARLLEQRRLIRYFEETTSVDSTGADVVMYVYFYHPRDRGRYSGRSAACHGTRKGFVFVPLDAATLGYYQALFAHELCHTLGASDKYDEDGSRYPYGYAEPARMPLHPQAHAEIMAMAIPRARGKEAYVEGVNDCVVGAWTAREMGWTRARRVDQAPQQHQGGSQPE